MKLTKNQETKRSIEIISTALYAGRKHWFVQAAARFFRKRPCDHLIEPFAGSAVVGFSLLYAEIVNRLTLVDKEEAVMCLLKGMLTDPSLADQYEAFVCTRENVKQVLQAENSAFRYLVLSRVSNRAKWWGGLRSEIDSRWCKDLVVANLRRVYELRDRVEVVHGDGLEVLRSHVNEPVTGCFADPPYSADPTSKGHTIYRHHELNHKALFSILADWSGPWLLSQDNSPTVRRLSMCHGFVSRRIRMNNSSNIIMHELQISRRRKL
jgi:site-specific DNA-adenine methylase